jgi:hypothetical protein
MFRFLVPPSRAGGHVFGLFLGQKLPNDVPLILILAADILIVNEALHGLPRVNQGETAHCLA